MPGAFETPGTYDFIQMVGCQRFGQQSFQPAGANIEPSVLRLVQKNGMVLAPRLLEFDFAVPPPPVPDQPGGVAKGETVEETERLLREVIELHVARQREDGLVVPDPSRVVDSVGVSA